MFHYLRDKTLPLPCVSTNFVSKSLPFIAVLRRMLGRPGREGLRKSEWLRWRQRMCAWYKKVLSNAQDTQLHRIVTL